MRLNKLFLPIILIFILVAFPDISQASPNYHGSLIDCREYQSLSEIKGDALKEKIESYLVHTTVPGLSVSFREVIDALIEEGLHVYLTGGVVRDLLSLSSAEPHDVDLDYSGTVDELIAILDKKGWRYTRMPHQSLVIIGDHRLGCIDAMPIKKDKALKESSLEFTINNIFYHCNSQAFSKQSEAGLKDLQNDRLNISAKDWNSWLYESFGHRYYKVFRFWKMVGKGYVYSTQMDLFFRREIRKILKADPETFFQEMLNYMAKHLHSFDEIHRGCVAVMGYEWSEKNFAALAEEAMKLQEEFDAQKDRHTYNLNPVSADHAGHFQESAIFDESMLFHLCL